MQKKLNCWYAAAVDAVVPEVMQGLAGGVRVAGGLLLLALRLGHPRERDDCQHHQHHQPYDYVGVADDCQVVQADVGLFGLR